MPAQKVVIDADPGVGDAIAIALALCDPDLDVVALTACGGRTSGEQAFRNLQTIVSMVDPVRWPRLGWSSSPATSIPDGPERSGMLLRDGTHGLANCEIIEALPHQPTESPKMLVELVREWPNELTLLSLGPLTNLQLAQERHPEFLKELKGLVCLGGALNAHGNVTAAAEFNVYADPEAARLVLTSPATKTLVPLETACQCGLSFDQYDSLRIDEFSRLGQFLCKTLPYILRESRNQLGTEGVLLPELCALAAIARPSLFERQTMQVDVEVAGELTRGMTVFDRRRSTAWKANIDVLTRVDSVGVRDYLTQCVRAADTE